VFLMGSVCGSFLNVCIYRIPQHDGLWPALRHLWSPPSHCPRCRTDICWRDNLPIVGWLLLRGRCRHCRMWISPRYPCVELLNALLFMLLYWCEIPGNWAATVAQSSLFAENGPQVVPGLGVLSPSAFLHLRYLYHLVLIESLVVASFIDLDRREIPDASTLPAMAIGLLGALVIGRVHIVPVWFQNSRLVASLTNVFAPDWALGTWPDVPGWFTAHPHLHGLLVSVVGLLVGGGITWFVRLVGFWVLRKEAMGFGDVVLMAVIGSFLGWQAAVIAFFIAPACALVMLPLQMFVHRDRYIPYGPYLSLGALITICAWNPIWNGTGPTGRWSGAERVFDLGPLLILVFVLMSLMFMLVLFLVQSVKWLFGWRDAVEGAALGEWTGADQTHYLAGENVCQHAGRWPSDRWPGVSAGRGCLHYDRWRGRK